MNQLSARACAEEAIFANKNTQEFLVHAQSLRRLGEWAASEMMGKDAEHVAHYAETLVQAGVAGIDPLANVAKDLRHAGFETSDTTVSHLFDKYLSEARRKLNL